MKSRGLIILTILSLLFLYTAYKGTHLWPERKGLAWLISFATITIIMSWQLIYRTNVEAPNFTTFRILAWSASLLMSLWATFLVCSIPFDIGHLLYRVGFKFTDKWAGWPPVDPERRTFVMRGISFGFLGASAVVSGIGYLQMKYGPKIKRISVPVRDLPPALAGLRIAQISDLHVGSTIHHDYVDHVVQQVIGLQPDLIAVTGDLADGSPEVLAKHLEPLAKLTAPFGTYYVTGNHEYYWGAQGWIDKCKTMGFIPLLNENKVILYKGVKVLVAGVTDTSSQEFIPSHQSSPEKAAINPEETQFKILLAHRPDSCFAAEPAGFDLQLSGHTHAGQFFPWSIFVKLAHKYYQGLNRHGRMWVYVNAGTGYWGPANRFAIPSEITLLELVNQSS
jgi:predicted MPP superfamily phosphohydrolase